MKSFRALNPQQLEAIKVGDVVTRLLGGIVSVDLKVSAIDDLIHCGPWTFHKQTGAEVDLELGWDGVTKTGSVLVYDQLKETNA